ncbi:MAG: ROK family protein [Ignavibacteriales bacterium]|nr:ROK family protein [Ignavibacteriales bacterium]
MILGLDIGGTKTAVVVGTSRGEILSRRQFTTASERGFENVFDELSMTITQVLASAPEPVKAISVSVGGPLDVLKGIINSPPNLPGWNNIPLKDLLTNKFSLPVFVEHDGNAGALAEFYFGAGRGFRNIVFLTMGTGLGAGLILDGRVYRGTTDTAGEVGHIRIAEDGPLCYGKSGSLEGYGSGTGIARLAHMMFPSLWGGSATVLDVYVALKQGSPEAKQVFERAATYLGRGFAMITDFINPQRIILGGLGLRIADAFLPFADAVFRQEALPQSGAACSIVPAQLGEAIGDVASLCAALDQGGMIDNSVPFRGGSH